MSRPFAVLAAASAFVALAAAPSFAAYHAQAAAPRVPAGMVSQQTIDAGPQLPDWESDDSAGLAQAELLYLQKVCPTVMAHQSAEQPNLVRFCEEPHG